MVATWPGRLKGKNNAGKVRGREGSTPSLDGHGAQHVRSFSFELADQLRELEFATISPSPTLVQDEVGCSSVDNGDFAAQDVLSESTMSPPTADSEDEHNVDVSPASCRTKECTKESLKQPVISCQSVATQTDGVSDTVLSAKLKHAITQRIQKQHQVSAKRLQVRELRFDLRFKRDEENGLRAALTKKLNVLFAQDAPTDPRSISFDFERFKSLADANIELEQSYHQAEDELEADEYALIKIDAKISQFIMQESSSLLEEDHLESDYEDPDDNSSTISGHTQAPPSMMEYMSRVGDVRLLQERLSELEYEWFAITEKQLQRQRMNMPLDEESLEFLSEYEETKLQTQVELDEALADVNRLRTICENQGLTDNYTDGLDVVHKLNLGEIVRQRADPLKVSGIDESSQFFEPGMSAKLDTTTFINKWILHCLRLSSFEIMRLKTSPELQDLWARGWDGVCISRLALQVWFEDGMGVSTPWQTPSGTSSTEIEVEQNPRKSADDTPRNRNRRVKSMPHLGRRLQTSLSDRFCSASI